MAAKPTASAKKDTTAPIKKSPAAAKEVKEQAAQVSTNKKAPVVAKVEPKKEVKATPAKVAPKQVEKKEATKTPAKPADNKGAKVITPKPAAKTKADVSHAEIKTVAPAKQEKKQLPYTVYHVSKRENDGREWKVFIQGSSKVIKLFDTQAEALAYAKSLCKNKDDGSYVVLHGLDGKIRKY